jgi:hypothetical protein
MTQDNVKIRCENKQTEVPRMVGMSFGRRMSMVIGKILLAGALSSTDPVRYDGHNNGPD